MNGKTIELVYTGFAVCF